MTRVYIYVPSGWPVRIREPDRAVNQRAGSQTGCPICEPYVTIIPAIQFNAMHNWEFRTESHQAQVALGTAWSGGG